MEEIAENLLNDTISKMSIIVERHWYQQPTAPDYYQFAACTVTKEDARFYDATTQNGGARSHGDAICTIDCLLPNKNAILQSLYFRNMSTLVNNCLQFRTAPDPKQTCDVNLLQNAWGGVSPSAGGMECQQLSFTNIQAGQWLLRVKIWDLTWSPQAQGSFHADDLAFGQGLYVPVNTLDFFGGLLFNPYNPEISTWLDKWVSGSGPLNKESFIADVLRTCGISDPDVPNDLQIQQNALNLCRTTYIAEFGTIVGYPGSIPVIPSTKDTHSTMGEGCQYVYDMSQSPQDRACPKIDDMCTRLTGQWRFSLATLQGPERVLALPSHLCQNINRSFLPPIGTLPWVESAITNLPQLPDPTNVYWAGMGIDGTGLKPTIEPQSWSSYIYRSCALQQYTASSSNCCANDFADGELGVIFNPAVYQSPPVDPNLPPGYHRSPLIGYNYETTGTPWYKSCFDVNGLTCDPQFRDITSDNCGILMLPHCVVNPETSAPQSWDINAAAGSQECTRWLGRLLYGPGGEWIQFLSAISTRGPTRDLTGTKLTREILFDISQNFGRVFNMQQIKDGTLTPLGQAMEPVIFTLYQNYNLNLYDNQVLSGQCVIYNIEDVVNNEKLRRWCGCMLNDASYASHYPEISVACTPTCNSSDVMQYGPPCQGTLCILDDITLTLINSTTAGVISIVQVCQSCGQVYSSDTGSVRETCDCRIDEFFLTAINSQLGTVNINELCGKDGNGGGKAAVPTQAPATRAIHALGSVTQTFPYTVVALLLIVAVLALTAFLVARGMKHGMPYLWARGLAVSCLIISAVIVAAIAYAVIVMTMD